MSMSVDKAKFNSALARLESMSKGQLHHTGSDSNPGTWAGTSQEDVNEHEDGIDANGTDYDGVKKSLARKIEKSQALTPAEVAIVKGQDPRKFIADKVSKGEALTAAESWVVKGGYAKMVKGNAGEEKAGVPGDAKDENSVPDSHAGDSDKNEETVPDAKKSLQGAAQSNPTLRKGLEMSNFLVEFTRAFDEALVGVETRIATSVRKAMEPVVSRISTLEKSLSDHAGSQLEFNKGSAEVLLGLGQHVASQTEIQAQAATQPVGGPRSQMRSGGQGGLQVVQKSFGPGGLETGAEAMAKSQVVDALTELSKAGKVSPLDVIKYETTGELSQPNGAMLNQFVSGGGR